MDALSLEQVCFVIAKAREFEVEEIIEDPDATGEEREVDFDHLERLTGREEDPFYDEVADFIQRLNVDQQIELVALAWLGRDTDATADDWDDLVEQARGAHNKRTARYLLGMPLLPDYLEQGLDALGFSCEDVEVP